MSRILPVLFPILLASILSLATASSTAHANNATPVVPPQILIVGDSLSAGFGIAREQSWPALLSQRLKAEGYPHDVTNISISGETTSGGLARLGATLERTRPVAVVIALGANDGLRGLPVARMRDNLQKMIHQSRAGKAAVLLVGMRLPPNYGADYSRNFAEVFTDLARQEKIPLVPFLFEGFAEQRDAFQNDGLHPTAAVQPQMLDTVWRKLKPLLRKP